MSQGQPLPANIVLDDLDRELERCSHRLARYADDFVILVKSKRAGERVMASVKSVIERKLKLRADEAKSKVVKLDQINFLAAKKDSNVLLETMALRPYKGKKSSQIRHP